ncbi:MAG TPA: hypothetical protein V6C97_36350 [Oculatellaceae cyanobacterium]
MISTIQHIVDKLNVRDAPKHIWQEPYEHDGTAYRRLCNLKGQMPDGGDLYDFCMDLLYSPSKIQLDLFRYLLPICLSAWKDVLLSRAPREFASFGALFFPALVRRQPLYNYLEPEEFGTVQEFVVETILERIRAEQSLQHAGRGDNVYSWFEAITDFAIVFPDLYKLWMKWWQLSSDGEAVAVLEYLSCLMYEDDCNPIFSPWSKENGGGPPRLNQPGSNFYQVGWKTENIEFLVPMLSPNYLEHGLHTSVGRLEQFSKYRSVCTKMSDDWSAQLYLVEWRIKQLPKLLADSDLTDWPLG